MSKIEHPLLKASRSQPAPMFVKSVEPPAPVEASEVKPPVNPFTDTLLKAELEKKKTIEKLLLFNKPITRQVTFDDLTFTFKLLNSEDSSQIFKLLNSYPESEQASKINLLLLSGSLVEANGVPLEAVYQGAAEVDNPFMQRFHVILQWPAPLVNALSREYRKFVDEEDKKYSFDFLGA